VTESDLPHGTPVSQAFDVPADPEGDPIRLALHAIDRVHGDGALPGISVRIEPLLLGHQGSYDPRIPRVVVSSSTTRPALTLLHEIGHVLDLHGLGRSSTLASRAHPTLDDWRVATTRSRACRVLGHIGQTSSDPVAVATTAYLLLKEELRARAYAQYVVKRSGIQPLLDQLDEVRRPIAGTIYLPRQWDDDDFIPIVHSIDCLFGRQRWIIRRPIP
jgi:hypothetical protein